MDLAATSQAVAGAVLAGMGWRHWRTSWPQALRSPLIWLLLLLGSCNAYGGLWVALGALPWCRPAHSRRHEVLQQMGLAWSLSAMGGWMMLPLSDTDLPPWGAPLLWGVGVVLASGWRHGLDALWPWRSSVAAGAGPFTLASQQTSSAGESVQPVAVRLQALAAAWDAQVVLDEPLQTSVAPSSSVGDAEGLWHELLVVTHGMLSLQTSTPVPPALWQVLHESLSTWLHVLASSAAGDEEDALWLLQITADANDRLAAYQQQATAMPDSELVAWHQLAVYFDRAAWLIRRMTLWVQMQTREQGASRERWRHNRLLQGLEAAHLDALASSIHPKRLHDGEVLYSEGEAADALWLIGQGEVHMERLIDEQRHTLDRLRRNDFVGETEWLQGRTRRATARCHGEVLAWSIDRQGLQRYSMLTGQDLLTQCIANQTAALSERLDNAELQQLTALRQGLQEAQLRGAFGTLLTHLILLIFVYTSALGGLQYLAQQQAATTWVTSSALLVMVAVAFWTVRQTGFPAQVFGWSLQDWRRDLLDACYWSLWVCAIITAAKWLLIRTVPAYAGLPLIAPWQASSGDWLDTVAAYGLYVLLSPMQEFVARGVIQGCLQHMLSGRNATWRAILVSNAVFSISHQHLGLVYALLVFVPGLFWGWLYQRHHSLVGVCVSHVLIGLWVTGMLDLSALVQR